MGTITYGQVERALNKLGFERVPNEQYFVMYHKKCDALLALANGEPGTIVRPAYRLAVENAVVGRGVATEADLNRALARARVRHRRVVVSPRPVFTPELVTAA